MATNSLRSLALLMLFLSCALLCSRLDYAYGHDDCKPCGKLTGKHSDKCKPNEQHDEGCCEENKEYDRYHCSPPVTSSTAANMTKNSFEEGGSGGGPSKCDGNFHSNKKMIVALSTGWFDNCSRCGKYINITSTYNGNSVLAMVVDMCDSMRGCDAQHAFLKPCRNDVVDASEAVWDALGIKGEDNIREYDKITWSDHKPRGDERTDCHMKVSD